MVAHLEQVGFPAAGFLQLVQIILDVFPGREDQLRITHLLEIGRRWLVLVGIDACFNEIEDMTWSPPTFAAISVRMVENEAILGGSRPVPGRLKRATILP